MSCPFSSVKPRWTRRKEARPQELLAAALDLFVERGYAATRLEDIAKHAGVSKGTLYLYFTNKEDLFMEMVRETVLPVIGEAEEIVGKFEGPSEALMREIITGWWERIGNTKLSGITKLIMAESGNFPEVTKFYHDEVIARGNSMIGSMLSRGIARGEFRDVDVKQTTNVICASVLMLMMWKHSFSACGLETMDPTQYLNNFIDVLLRGVMADPTNHSEAKMGKPI